MAKIWLTVNHKSIRVETNLVSTDVNLGTVGVYISNVCDKTRWSVDKIKKGLETKGSTIEQLVRDRVEKHNEGKSVRTQIEIPKWLTTVALVVENTLHSSSSAQEVTEIQVEEKVEDTVVDLDNPYGWDRTRYSQEDIDSMLRATVTGFFSDEVGKEIQEEERIKALNFANSDRQYEQAKEEYTLRSNLSWGREKIEKAQEGWHKKLQEDAKRKAKEQKAQILQDSKDRGSWRLGTNLNISSPIINRLQRQFSASSKTSNASSEDSSSRFKITGSPIALSFRNKGKTVKTSQYNGEGANNKKSGKVKKYKL